MTRGQSAYLAHYKSSQLFAFHDPAEVAGGVDIQYDDRQIILLAKGKGGHVHDTESISDDFGKSDLINLDCIFIFLRIRSVDAIYARAFEDDFSIDFICT